MFTEKIPAFGLGKISKTGSDCSKVSIPVAVRFETLILSIYKLFPQPLRDSNFKYTLGWPTYADKLTLSLAHWALDVGVNAVVKVPVTVANWVPPFVYNLVHVPPQSVEIYIFN